jgi:hypothetical protein
MMPIVQIVAILVTKRIMRRMTSRMIMKAPKELRGSG